VSRRLALLAALLPLVGCGPKQAPTAVPVDVSGRLTAGGKPFGNVMLTLHPQDAASQGQQPVALVKADGTFAARCLPGNYKVTLTPLPRAPGDGGPGDTGRPDETAGGVPTAYTTAANTPWAITVKEAGNEEFRHAVAK
jgi:hypothetical protein